MFIVEVLRRYNMRRNVKAAVIAALIVTGANAFTMVSATTVESHTDGKSIGLNLWGGKETLYR